jgi:hypothetical protein
LFPLKRCAALQRAANTVNSAGWQSAWPLEFMCARRKTAGVVLGRKQEIEFTPEYFEECGWLTLSGKLKERRRPRRLTRMCKRLLPGPAATKAVAEKNATKAGVRRPSKTVAAKKSNRSRGDIPTGEFAAAA